MWKNENNELNGEYDCGKHKWTEIKMYSGGTKKHLIENKIAHRQCEMKKA